MSHCICLPVVNTRRTRLVQWISSEIKLKKRHCTRLNPKPYSGAYYISGANTNNNRKYGDPDTVTQCPVLDWRMQIQKIGKSINHLPLILRGFPVLALGKGKIPEIRQKILNIQGTYEFLFMAFN